MHHHHPGSLVPKYEIDFVNVSNLALIIPTLYLYCKIGTVFHPLVLLSIVSFLFSTLYHCTRERCPFFRFWEPILIKIFLFAFIFETHEIIFYDLQCLALLIASGVTFFLASGRNWTGTERTAAYHRFHSWFHLFSSAFGTLVLFHYDPEGKSSTNLSVFFLSLSNFAFEKFIS